MKVTSRVFALIALLALVVSVPVFAQSTPPQNPPPSPPTQPGTPATPGTALPEQPAAPPVNAAEEADYKAFFEAKDHTLKVKLGEAFQDKYPTSRYREVVYVNLSNSYQSLGQEDKMSSACEKAIELNPDNVPALVTMTKLLSRRTKADALDAQQKFERAEKLGKHALELLATLTKPESVPEENFVKSKNIALADVHSGLGLVYLQKQRVAESVIELEQATKVSDAPDPVDFYLLGIALQMSKRFDESAAAFGSCAAMTSQMQPSCKQGEAESKKLAAAKPPAPAKP